MPEDPIRYRNPDVVHHLVTAITAVGGTIGTDALTTIAHTYGQRLAYPTTTIDRTIADLHAYGILRYTPGRHFPHQPTRYTRLTRLGEAWVEGDFTTTTILIPAIVNGLEHPTLKTWAPYNDPGPDNFAGTPSPPGTPTPLAANPFT